MNEDDCNRYISNLILYDNVNNGSGRIRDEIARAVHSSSFTTDMAVILKTHFMSRDHGVVCIPISARDVIRRINLNNVGAGILICASYLHYRNNINSQHEFQVTTRHVPFKRLLFDFDYLDDSAPVQNQTKFVYETASMIVKCLVERLCITNKAIITRRFGSDAITPSFHLVTYEQFDSASANEIVHTINEILNEQLRPNRFDFTIQWSVPGDRGHLPVAYITKECEIVEIEREKVSFTDWLAMSPIDLFDRSNFKTILSSSVARSIANADDDARNCVNASGHDTLVRLSPDVGSRPEHFIRKFKQYQLFTHLRTDDDGEESSGSRYRLEDLGRFFIGNPDVPKLKDAYGENEDDVENEEFYDILYATKLKFKTPPVEIFRPIDIIYKDMKFDLIKEGFSNLYASAQHIKAAEVDFHNRIVDYMHDEDEIHTFECLRSIGVGFRWEQCILSVENFLNQIDPAASSHVIYLYVNYCIANSLPVLCTRSMLADAVGSVFEGHFVDSNMHIHGQMIDGMDFAAEDAMYIHIFKMLMVKRHITALVSILLHARSFETDCEQYKNLRLYYIAASLFGIMDPTPEFEHAKHTLIQMVKSTMDGNVENLAGAIMSSYLNPVIIFFLCDFESDDLSGEDMYRRYCDRFGVIGCETRPPYSNSGPGDARLCVDENSMDSLSSVGNKRRKPAADFSGKKKRATQCDGNLNESSKRIFTRFVICLWKYQFHVFAYQNMEFSSIEVVKIMPYYIHMEYARVLNEPECGPFSYVYRREPGIYNSVTGIFERHSPALLGRIFIRTQSTLSKSYDIYDNFNYDVKNAILDTLLKAGHFIDYCHFNKNAVILLAPILPQNQLSQTSVEYAITSIQIEYFYLNAANKLPIEFIYELFQNENMRYAIRWLYMIICRISTFEFVNIYKPSDMIYDMFSEVDAHAMGILEGDLDDLDESKTSSQIGDTGSEFSNKFISDVENMFIEAIRNKISNLRRSTVNIVTCTKSDDANLISDVEFKRWPKNKITDIGRQNKSQMLNGVFMKEVFSASPIPSIISNDKLFSSIDHQMGTYVINLLSWFIRMGPKHVYANTNFFQFISKNQVELYETLRAGIFNVIGGLMMNENIENLTEYFKRFCRGTEVSINDSFSIPFPRGYRICSGVRRTKFDDDIFLGVTNLIAQSQFTKDILIDMYKQLYMMTHRGNYHRFSMILLNRTATGKNVFISTLMDILYKTHTTQELKGSDIKCEAGFGCELADPMNTNLVVWFDEVTSLSTAFKNIVNTGCLKWRTMYQIKQCLARINSHVIVSTNGDPICTDAAIVARLRPYNRTFQYVELKKNSFIANTKCISDTSVTMTNEIFGIQMLLGRLPRSSVRNMGELGIFLLVWIGGDIFFNSFGTPTSLKTSKLMSRVIQKFMYSAQPARYIIDNNLFKITPGNTISLDTFDNQAMTLLKQIKPISGSALTIAVNELKDMFSNYITSNNQIHVSLG